METKTKETGNIGTDFFDRLWEESWTYIKTVVDVVREPVLILDKDFRVMAANESFYRAFQVEPKDTEKKIVYDLGNGQWDIPALRKLLEDILPKNTFFKGFEVTHEFPSIGRKIMMLNARQIHFKEKSSSELFPPIILLAMEDVTEMMMVAETFASQARQLEAKFIERSQKLEAHIEKLDKEINELKTKTV
ncbi:PAS domain-containing protein [Candidatus Parcubacteria bacterium]|jgi:PAS domain-containing protein|nr:MAG: PAS domain-containing protein [Candidatus Parcubacteria bacterium]